MASGYDIGFADSNAASQASGFYFSGGGKNSSVALAIVAAISFVAAGALAWLIFRHKTKS